MRPQVVAHRGASDEIAEHTLAAYVRALDEGAEALECDVRLTADGHLVCVHDRTLRRTASNRGVVSTMALDELSELDFATWKNPWDFDDEALEHDDDLGGVLTLRRLLETAADYDRPVEVAVETKHPTRFGGLVEKRLAEMLGEFGWTTPGSPVRVMSFSFTALQRMERLCPDVELVQLVDRAAYWPVLKASVGRRWTMGPGIDMVREHTGLVRRMRERGHPVHVWTVNKRVDLELCLDVGVSACITDRPSHLVKLLDEREARPPGDLPDVDPGPGQ